jgi:PAT family beta-lactamase induction signal transducer AmpG
MSADTSTAESRASADGGPWWWVPTLYFAEGVPYVVVMTVAVIMFKRLGVGNTQIALYTSWLYLPYAIKPLWSPLVQRIGTRRGWVVAMELLVAAGLACAALAIPLASFLRWSLVALATTAISSATHDVAADGFYLVALSPHQQAWFVGIRSTAYRMAMIAGQGLLVMLAGVLESSTGLPVVDVHVRAADVAPASIGFEPAQFVASIEGETQRIAVSHDDYQISLRDRSAAEVQALRGAVHQWNIAHSFYEEPLEQKKDAAMGAKTGWRVSLENFIRHWLGPKAPSTTAAGNRAGDVAIVLMRMARPVPPGESQVVQFGHVAGDTSFTAIEGERFVVSDANWNQPFAAVVQVDWKLDHPSEATFQVRSGNLPLAWSVTFFVVAGVFFAFCAYHFFALPRPAADAVAADVSAATGGGLAGFLVPFVDFFRKPRIVAILAFLLLYRFPEAQLVKLTTPFLLDPHEVGGLALTTGTVGFIYGTVGVIMLTVGGIIGGFVVARHGIGRWLWPMALAMHLPNLAFLVLAYLQPANRWVITAGVAVEQFGYGFGFTAYMLYCVYVASGKHQTVHYALCTGCMALGMMIPGMWSGWLQELIGYQHFFVWIMLAMIPSVLAVALIPLDPTFGKKAEDKLAGNNA